MVGLMDESSAAKLFGPQNSCCGIAWRITFVFTMPEVIQSSTLEENAGKHPPRATHEPRRPVGSHQMNLETIIQMQNFLLYFR